MRQEEPLLKEDPSRFVVYPIKHHDMWDYYKKAFASLWSAEEIDLTSDLKDWNRMTEGEQHFIGHTLAFFAASDGIVNENLAINFMKEVQPAEARSFYGFQIAMENVHSETYSLLIDTYIKDPKEKDHLLNALETVPAVKMKGEWALKWIDSPEFVDRLIAFAAVEGIFFSSSFASIFYMRKRGYLPGLCFANDLISRDEALHCDFACMLYRDHIVNKVSREHVLAILKDAVRIEQEFCSEAMPVRLIGMNSDEMKKYIEFVCDGLLVNLGYAKEYNTPNPFDFMEMIAVESKANFFEKRVGEYSKAGITTGKATSLNQVDEDF